MVSSHVATVKFACPECGARYEVPKTTAGRRAPCAKCGAELSVPAAPADTARSLAALLEEEDSYRGPQYVGVECRVCQTRLYGTTDQVGQELKCPDCGARTVLRPPPAPVKRPPAALEGEQYEVWDAEAQPLPSELIAAQPVYVAVTCKRCDTLMYATLEQVGQTIACPDCGRQHIVPPPPVRKPRPSVLAGDESPLAVDTSADPGERPAAISAELRRKIEEEERNSEYGRALERSRRTGKPMGIDTRGRPILPRWPLVTGVWRMLLTEEVFARWFFLSIVLGFAGQFLGEALLTPLQGMAEAIKLIFAVVGGMLVALWLTMFAPFIVAIVCESADGHDKLQQPPRLIAFDRLNAVFSVVMAGSIAGLCGFGVSQLIRLTPLAPTASASMVAMTVAMVLPFALLSTLLEGSPFGIVSSRLFSSMAWCARAWLLFYTQTFALTAFVGAAAWIISLAIEPQRGEETILLWCLAPFGIAALFIDMRLLGRLAWLISEQMPEDEEGKEGET